MKKEWNKKNLPLKIIFWPISFVLVFFLVFAFKTFKAKADNVFFYPNICLGGWTNPQNAAKEPTSQDILNYDYSNSAVKEPDSTGQIFCGEFDGEIPKDTEISSLSLKLGLFINNNPPEKIILDPIESNEPIMILPIEDEDTVIDAPSQEKEDVFSEEKEDIVLPVEDETETETETETENILIQEESVNSDELSFGIIKNRISGFFIKIATAQELQEQLLETDATEIVTATEVTSDYSAETITEEITTEDAEIITEEPTIIIEGNETQNVENLPDDNTEDQLKDTEIANNEEQNEITGEDTIIEQNTEEKEIIILETEELISLSTENETKESSVDIDTDLLEVSYTIDSIVWEKIGIINSDNWQNVELVLPIEDFNSWQNLSKLQIRIDSLPSFDNDPTFYLENIQLSINYEKIKEKIDPESQNNTKILTSENKIQGMDQAEILNENEYGNDDQVPEKNEKEESVETITEQQLETIITRTYSKEIKVDESGTHYCAISDFTIDISENDFTKSEVELFRSITGNYEIEIGSLPNGIDVLFSKNKDYLYRLAEDENILEIEILKKDKSAIGSFSIPFIFTHKNNKIDSSVICQLNIINI